MLLREDVIFWKAFAPYFFIFFFKLNKPCILGPALGAGAEIYLKLKQSNDIGKDSPTQNQTPKKLTNIELFNQRLHERNARRESIFLSVTP